MSNKTVERTGRLVRYEGMEEFLSLRHRILDQVINQVSGQVRDKVYIEIRRIIHFQADAQVGLQVWDRIDEIIKD